MSKKAHEFFMDHVSNVIADHLVANHPGKFGAPALGTAAGQTYRAGWRRAINAVSDALVDLFGEDFPQSDWIGDIEYRGWR